VTVRSVDHDKIDSGRDQSLGAGETLVADCRCRSNAKATLFVLAGIRIGNGLLDILYGDEADASILRIHYQQLLDAVLMQQTFGFVLAHALAYGDELIGHQLGDFLARISRETDVAICEDTDQLAGLRVAGTFNNRNS
jgi:hypothetical protein